MFNSKDAQKILTESPAASAVPDGSADGKANATRMALDALCSFFHVEATYEIAPPMPAETTIHASSLAEAHLQIYNPMVDSCALKSMSSSFENLRGNYPLRREALAYHIELD